MKHLPYITSVFFYLMLYSCANIVPPSGGEKDVDAPLMESQTPDNQSVNFIEDEIVIEFNEYIQYSSSSSSLVISPPMTVAPEINIKGKKLEIIFQEVLLPNTTYTLNFGDNVKDWNEGNAYRGLQYVFSTGNKLDSTSLQGRVLSAKEKEPIENVQVMLYEENTDSILVNSKPYYITQTNSSGMFSFTHLKAGIYQIAALSDKNFNYLYDQSTEQIAFLNQKIALTTSHELNEDLFLFAEKQDLKIEQEIVQKGYITFAFSEAIESITFDTEIYDEK
ncbi:MAG: Ig-like domain-containing protein, partial [Chitinophagales bacterium]